MLDQSVASLRICIQVLQLGPAMSTLRTRMKDAGRVLIPARSQQAPAAKMQAGLMAQRRYDPVPYAVREHGARHASRPHGSDRQYGTAGLHCIA